MPNRFVHATHNPALDQYFLAGNQENLKDRTRVGLRFQENKAAFLRPPFSCKFCDTNGPFYPNLSCCIYQRVRETLSSQTE
jgi:hypothetical protein